ncbi:hypothetical protein [Thiococcus pfennigii]|uniref:hypothetical protein n=1 Tax=Thiococcus pfennigii TaxID=1057 RepID=UPI001908CF45|nr:hypothetical protein [Thiococcus pfennigii]MBK1702372.1 hypothetical protein [Thiococcus pfennigii]MBK1733445.1 hypothetical protein [Thiococcus pfennigii]
MQALIQFFFELCLLRRAPQDLPASDWLFRLVLAASFLVGVLAALIAGLPLALGVLQSLAQLALLLTVLYFGLGWLRRPGRFLQAATALLGTGTLLSLLALVPIGLLPLEPSGGDGTLAALLLLALFAWSIVVSGHILRHTLGVTLGQGAAIAILYELASLVLLGGLFPGTGS